VVWNVLAIGIILAGMGLALRFQLRRNLLAQIDLDLKQELSRVTAIHHEGDKAVEKIIDGLQGHKMLSNVIEQRKLRQSSVQLAEIFKTSTDEVSLQRDPEAAMLYPVSLFEKHDVALLNPIDPDGFRASTTGSRALRTFKKDGRWLRSLSEPVRGDNRVLAVAQATRELAPVDRQIHQLDISIATMIPFVLLVATVAGALLVGSTMRPLRRLTESARLLDPTLSAKRLPVAGNDEFADLAEAFNEALDRNAAAFEAQSQALKQLERFTGDAGHELRTPLGAIKGSVTFLLHGRKWGNDARKSLEIIDRSSDRMTRLIGDLLLLARHDGGQVALKNEHLALSSLVKEAAEFVGQPHHVSLRLDVDPELKVVGDSLSLIRVLTNLISNAFTYAQSEVLVTATACAGVVKVTVEDDGEGISPEHLPRLGERFFRPESARTREQGGTGLGLAIVKSILETQGGTMNIESKVGVGTKVHLELRYAGVIVSQ